MRSTLFLLLAGSLYGQSVADCEAHKRRGRLAELQRCYEQLSTSRDLLQRAEGLWGLGLTQDANNAFRAASAANPKSAEIKIRWGRFFLDRWQKEDAAALFEEAMEIRKDHPQALLGMALLASEGFEKKAVEFAQKALDADPKLVEAQALLASYEAKKVQAEKDAAEIVAAAKDEANRLKTEAAQKLDDFVARRTKQAELKIAQAEAQAAAEVRAAAADLATLAAGKLLADSSTTDKSFAAALGEIKAKLN